MNNVNKDNAIGLKDIGFDVPTPGYWNTEVLPNELMFDPPGEQGSVYINAPDFLSAADFLFDKHNIEIAFRKSVSFVFYEGDNDVFGKKDTFRQADHRN